jgi:antitoxin component of MazEF toxin-antitoxin module
MIAKLVKHGEELALVIDRSLIELLGIDETTPLEVSTEGQTLLVIPVRDEERRKRLEDALASVNKRYAATFKRLAE